MGCMTGFYLITKELDLNQVTEIVRDVFDQNEKWAREIAGGNK